jgi:hypothetical protein
MAYTLEVMPDDELAVIQYLRSLSQVTALVPSARITTELPMNPTYPAITVKRIGGLAANIRRIDEPAIQIDVYGPEDRHTCKQVARTVRAAIVAIANDTVSEGVLVSATEEVGLQWLPDTELGVKPLPRYTARYRVLLHK